MRVGKGNLPPRVPLYASGVYRLREASGLSERARLGIGTVVVPAGQGSTIADVGEEAESGSRCVNLPRWRWNGSCQIGIGRDSQHRRHDLTSLSARKSPKE